MIILLTYLSSSKIYFASQNASHNVVSCTKLILFIVSGNAKHYSVFFCNCNGDLIDQKTHIM